MLEPRAPDEGLLALDCVLKNASQKIFVFELKELPDAVVDETIRLVDILFEDNAHDRAGFLGFLLFWDNSGSLIGVNLLQKRLLGNCQQLMGVFINILQEIK